VCGRGGGGFGFFPPPFRDPRGSTFNAFAVPISIPHLERRWLFIRVPFSRDDLFSLPFGEVSLFEGGWLSGIFSSLFLISRGLRTPTVLFETGHRSSPSL